MAKPNYSYEKRQRELEKKKKKEEKALKKTSSDRAGPNDTAGEADQPAPSTPEGEAPAA
jgi:hypothetical protein